MIVLPTEFTGAIIAEKADDLPRLIAADWLDEHGDQERAEFIRVQCELTRSTCDRNGPIRCISDWASPELCSRCHRTATLRNREFTLLTSHRLNWINGTLGPILGNVSEHFDQLILTDAANWGRRNPPIIRPIFRRGFIGEMVCTWRDWDEHGLAIANATPLQGVWLSTIPSALSGNANDVTVWTNELTSRWPNIAFTIPRTNGARMTR